MNNKFACDVCGYIYDPTIGDPEGGIAPNTDFYELDAEWTYPICGVGIEEFIPLEEESSSLIRDTSTERIKNNGLKNI